MQFYFLTSDPYIFYFFSNLIKLVRISTMLNSSDKNKHSYSILNLRRNAFSLSFFYLCMMIAIGFLLMIFI